MRSIMLCYNLKGTKKGRKIGMLGSFLGFRVKYVEKEEYSQTIGVLTGLKEETAVEKTSAEEKKEHLEADGEKREEITDFEEEMLVMLLADSQILDKLLFQMRKEKVQVPLKAIVTAKNQNWTSPALYREVKREHESMMKAEQAGREKEE